MGALVLLVSALTALGYISTAKVSALPSLPNQPIPLGDLGNFNEHIFRRKISSALATVSRVLENTRSPRLAADHEDHSYDDKFGLAEFITNSALAASLNAFDRLGMDESKLGELKNAVDQNKSVTLRFSSTETCEFIEEKETEIEGHQYETYETTEKGDVIKEKKRTRSKVVRKVKEYHWLFGVKYSVTAFAGTGSDHDTHVTLKSRSGSAKIIVSGSKTRPSVEVHTPPAREVDITWFLKQFRLDSETSTITPQFSIDRATKECLTPRRNREVSDAEQFFRSLRQWSDAVSSYFTRTLRSRLMVGRHGNNLSEQTDDLIRVESMKNDLFVPVLPLFESGNETMSTSPLMGAGDMDLFLNEQCRSMDKKIDELVSTFPSSEGDVAVSSAEASIALITNHCSSICELFCDGLGSIEEMLRTQLVRAIGKDLAPSDFDEFLRYHYGKLFKETYVPGPFMYAIRRPDHYPDGTLSIEGDRAGGERNDGGTSSSNPIVTTTRKIEDSAPMYLPVSPATNILFKGDRYLHAWVRHDFGGSSYTSGFNLVARARQFSSFMLVIGTISGPNSFSPQNAIIVQNKDEVLIPLLLEQLPTPKEFKDAIESLSPEQKRFCKAFRDMQLSTSVFGVLVVQLKPQLEVVLGLPYDSLTKEIRLTQDLLSLFMQYQIPSDLLSFDGSEDASAVEKVDRVKAHVRGLHEMIEDVKKKDLEEEQRKADMAKRKKRGTEQFGGEVEEDEDSGGHFNAGPERRILRAQTAPHAERVMPQMMMAASVADDMVSAGGMEDFGEVRMMSAQAVPEGSAHLRAQRGMDETVQTQTSDQGKPPAEHPGARSFSTGQAFDFSQIPKQLDQSFEELDDTAALRPTKIKPGNTWTKKYHVDLLTPLETKALGEDDQKAEKDKAFDLLDALSKSGALPLSYTELHVMVAATHHFDRSLVDTVISQNTNPIEKMEKSLLIVSSTINALPVNELVGNDRAELVRQHSPALLEFNQDKGDGDSEEALTE